MLFVLHQKKEYEKRIECQFEAFCKKVLRNEARKCYRELKRQRGREIPLEEIVVNYVQLLHYKLDFSVGHDFLAFGVLITIHDERLADKLIISRASWSRPKNSVLSAYGGNGICGISGNTARRCTQSCRSQAS